MRPFDGIYIAAPEEAGADYTLGFMRVNMSGVHDEWTKVHLTRADLAALAREAVREVSHGFEAVAA